MWVRGQRVWDRTRLTGLGRSAGFYQCGDAPRGALLALVVVLFSAPACSGDDSGNASGGAGGSAGTAGGNGGGGASSAGTGGETDAGMDAVADAPAADAGAVCPTSLPGPGLVLVASASGQAYCIDSTEVTQAQYQAFLATNPATATQSAVCAWNTSFVPVSIPGAVCFEPGSKFDPGATPDHPVACVDWCDAAAYCAWAGKRLCGRIGGGATDPGKLADAAESEWFNACSKQGQLVYPYGNTYEPKRCNDLESRPLPFVYIGVPSTKFPNCEGGFPGLFQMSGNLWEWEDGCLAAAGAMDECPLRGGAAGSQEMALRCEGGGGSSLAAGDTVSTTVGFRCCADAS